MRETASQMGEAVRAMNGARTPWLPGYRVKVLDGNCIEATEHRLEVVKGNTQWCITGQITGSLRTRTGNGH